MTYINEKYLNALPLSNVISEKKFIYKKREKIEDKDIKDNLETFNSLLINDEKYKNCSFSIEFTIGKIATVLSNIEYYSVPNVYLNYDKVIFPFKDELKSKSFGDNKYQYTMPSNYNGIYFCELPKTKVMEYINDIKKDAVQKYSNIIDLIFKHTIFLYNLFEFKPFSTSLKTAAEIANFLELKKYSIQFELIQSDLHESKKSNPKFKINIYFFSKTEISYIHVSDEIITELLEKHNEKIKTNMTFKELHNYATKQNITNLKKLTRIFHSITHYKISKETSDAEKTIQLQNPTQFEKQITQNQNKTKGNKQNPTQSENKKPQKKTNKNRPPFRG